MTRRNWQVVLVLVVGGAVAWFVAQAIRNRRPYQVDSADLSGWSVVLGGPDDTVTVGLQPPSTLTDRLFAQVADRAGTPLEPAPQPIVPLILRHEFDESLMGVLSAEEVLAIARESGIESAAFEPVCMAEHVDTSDEGDARLFFVLFHSAAFDKARADIVLMHPEHGGGVEFDPAALTPKLAIASTDAEFGRWWTELPQNEIDCQTGVRTE